MLCLNLQKYEIKCIKEVIKDYLVKNRDFITKTTLSKDIIFNKFMYF